MLPWILPTKKYQLQSWADLRGVLWDSNPPSLSEVLKSMQQKYF